MSRRPKPSLESLEARLGYSFRDRSLLEQALTHISAVSAEMRSQSYQRLEFLGDRVLGLGVAALLYARFPTEAEGALSRRLSALVRKETCALVATDWDLGAHLRLGAGESQSGGRKRLTILGDACEAVIGAIFIDAGFEAAQRVIGQAWSLRLEDEIALLADAKSRLQEWAQAQGLKAPSYHLTSRRGPDHKPSFTVAVEVENWPAAEGSGHSKRLAEQAAAAAFMAEVLLKAEA